MAWSPPPWHAKPAARIRFVRELRGVRNLEAARSARYKGAFGVQFDIEPRGVPSRHVQIFFKSFIPHVFVDGPVESPHRFADGGLCMWYPEDPPERKWKRRDGGGVLVADISAHLVKEEWWRMTGEWPGGEVRHGRIDPLNDPRTS
jgi:hypothetical protein